MNEVIIALASAGGGAIFLKIIDTFFLSRKGQIDAATEFRDELRKEIQSVKGENQRLEKEIDKCKNRCYRLMEVMAYHGIPIPPDIRQAAEEDKLTIPNK